MGPEGRTEPYEITCEGGSCEMLNLNVSELNNLVPEQMGVSISESLLKPKAIVFTVQPDSELVDEWKKQTEAYERIATALEYIAKKLK